MPLWSVRISQGVDGFVSRVPCKPPRRRITIRLLQEKQRTAFPTSVLMERSGRLATLRTLRSLLLASTNRPRHIFRERFGKNQPLLRFRWCFESSAPFAPGVARDATLLFLQNFIELCDKLKKLSGVAASCAIVFQSRFNVGHFCKFPSRSVTALHLLYQRL